VVPAAKKTLFGVDSVEGSSTDQGDASSEVNFYLTNIKNIVTTSSLVF
jgi:hypothetical protein